MPPVGSEFRCHVSGNFLCAPSVDRRDLLVWDINSGMCNIVPVLRKGSARPVLLGAEKGKFVYRVQSSGCVYDPEAGRTVVHPLEASVPPFAGETGRFVWHSSQAGGSFLNVVNLAAPSVVERHALHTGLRITALAVTNDSVVAVDTDARMLQIWDDPCLGVNACD